MHTWCGGVNEVPLLVLLDIVVEEVVKNVLRVEGPRGVFDSPRHFGVQGDAADAGV